jgi:hypothetical protein
MSELDDVLAAVVPIGDNERADELRRAVARHVSSRVRADRPHVDPQVLAQLRERVRENS